MTAKAQDAEEIIRRVARVALRLCGTRQPSIFPMPGQASTRRYFRLKGPSGSVVVMAGGSAREEAGEPDDSRFPFLTLQQRLRAAGLPVPRIYDYFDDCDLLLMEDLGDRRLFDVRPEAREAAYREAIDTLVRFQRTCDGEREAMTLGRRFDEETLRWELDHFRQWLLEEQRGACLSRDEVKLLEAEFDRVVAELLMTPFGWVHRDYQSKNIMLCGPQGRQVVIDFQDALVGPKVYDLVALLRDSYIDLGESVSAGLLDYYYEAAGVEDRQSFLSAFQLQTIQRKLKDAGRFVFIDRVKGNPDFLPYIPLTLGYVASALETLPRFRRLQALLARHLPEFGRPD